MRRRVLVTGHRGYIGPHVVELLKESGHHVTGCDLGLFEGCSIEPLPAADVEWTRDVRSLGAADLEGFDAIVHLAAISNDPMGELDPELTREVNALGSIALATAARDAGVTRFLLSGSCSVYGRQGDAPLGERAPLRPVSAYAESKIEAERGIHALATPGFSPTSLRNATAYGWSPMLRIDLVVNNFVANAIATGRIDILSDGTPWRPILHCRDIAGAFVACLETPRERVHDLVVNVGRNDGNHQVSEIAEVVREIVPDARIHLSGEATDDPRSYCVSFDRLGEAVPAFRPMHDLRSGAESLRNELLAHGFDAAALRSDRFVRLKRLRQTARRLMTPAAPAAGYEVIR